MIFRNFDKEGPMTHLLLNWFVPNWKEKMNADSRSAVGSLSGAVGIVCNL